MKQSARKTRKQHSYFEHCTIIMLVFLPSFFGLLNFIPTLSKIALRVLIWHSSHVRAVPANFSQPVPHKKNAKIKRRSLGGVKLAFFHPKGRCIVTPRPACLHWCNSGAMICSVYSVIRCSARHSCCCFPVQRFGAVCQLYKTSDLSQSSGEALAYRVLSLQKIKTYVT